MKIIRLLFILYDRPNYPGGPIINYLRLLPALVNNGYEVHVLVFYSADFPNARILRRKGVHIHITPSMSDDQKAVEWILKQVEKIQPDIFIPDVSIPGCIAGKWVKASGIPVVNSHRSDDENNWGKAIYFSDDRYGFSASAVFCVSNYLLEQLKQKIQNFELLTAVIPSGVPVPESYTQQNNPISIVYVGRLIQRQKKIFEVVDTFRDLASSYDDINFTFVGDGPDRKKCEELIADSGFKARFIFTGMLTGDSYTDELARHDIVVLLSEYEGVPGSLMDSMASGLIPICYHYPGAEELIINNETGFLVNDRKNSVNEIVSLLRGDIALRRRISQNARQHILTHFSLEGTIDKWNEFITALIRLSDGRSSSFVMPSKIDLPPANQLLTEYIIGSDQSIIQRIRSRLKSFIKKYMDILPDGEFDNFVKVPFNSNNLDKYFIRKSIITALEWSLSSLSGQLLDAGCGKMPYREYIIRNSAVQDYIGLDIETALIYDENIKPDHTWDGRVMPFENESFDSCIAIEVLEHCPEPEVFLKEVYRVLRPGSAFFFTVPFLWNLHEVPNDEYRYTPFALERHLRNSGFDDIELKATGGWHASLSQMLGLWVRRAPMWGTVRRLLSILFMPVIRWLIKRDVKHPIAFSESQMITGLYGLAKKI